MGEASERIVITGAAGLVGQNLVALLAEEQCTNLVAIDKNGENLAVLARLHPDVRTRVCDLAEPGEWEDEIADADVVVMLHAQITGKTGEPFARNNVEATKRVLAVLRERGHAFVVHASSSVVNSVAHDLYTESKKPQERLVADSGIAHCILRPTLMFGWFDPKHLGWLARFMERTPVFPIPGHGRYMRQPLYDRDFCRAIAVCIRSAPARRCLRSSPVPNGSTTSTSIRAIREAKGLRTPIVPIPFALFKALLRVYALFSAKPPFTAEQLDALVAGDDFSGVDIEATFGFRPTPFRDAIRETFGHPVYSRIGLASPH